MALGTQLEQNDVLISGNSVFRFIVQSDCILVVYNDELGITFWSSGTSSSNGCRLSVQSDCNLVLHETSGSVLWTTGTRRKCTTGAFRVNDDGTVELVGTLVSGCRSQMDVFRESPCREATRFAQQTAIFVQCYRTIATSSFMTATVARFGRRVLLVRLPSAS